MLFLLRCVLCVLCVLSLRALGDDPEYEKACSFFLGGWSINQFFIYNRKDTFSAIANDGRVTETELFEDKRDEVWKLRTTDLSGNRRIIGHMLGHHWEPVSHCIKDGAVLSFLSSKEMSAVIMVTKPNTFQMCAFFPGYLYNSRDHLITGASSMSLCAEYALTYGGVYYVAYDVNSKNCIASRDSNARTVAEGKGGKSYVCQLKSQPMPGDPKIEEPKELGTASSYDECFKLAVTRWGHKFDMAKWNPKTQDCTCGVVKKVSHNYPDTDSDITSNMMYGWNPKLPLVNSLATTTSTTTSTATSTTGNLHSVSTTTTTPLTFDSSVSALSVASKILTFILPFVAFF